MVVAHHILSCDDDKFRTQNLSLNVVIVAHLRLKVSDGVVPLNICTRYYYNSWHTAALRYKEFFCVYIGRSFATLIDQCAGA